MSVIMTISKVSEYPASDHPVPDAILRDIPFDLNWHGPNNGTDLHGNNNRYFSSIEEAHQAFDEPPKNPGGWHNFFTNGHVTGKDQIYGRPDGHVVIRGIKTLPVVTFQSLDDLLAFVDREGDIVMSPYGPECLDADIKHDVLIYDNYIE